MIYQTFWSTPATNHFHLSNVERGLQQSAGKLIAVTQLHVCPVSWLWALTRNYRYFLFCEMFLSQRVSEEIRKKGLQAKCIPKRYKLGFFQKKTVLTGILQYIFCKYLYLLQYIRLCMKICVHTHLLGHVR